MVFDKLLSLSFTLDSVAIFGTLSGIVGYLLMRKKFVNQLKIAKKREGELASKAYETAALKEIGDRIGYSLDASKIVEIISGSLGTLLPYSTVSHMILDEEHDRIVFSCHVSESVSSGFVQMVKQAMIAAFSQMNGEHIAGSDVDESISGAILDDKLTNSVGSFFNLPIVISNKLVGLINVASVKGDLYSGENTAVLYRIARQASDAVSKLQEVLENEKGRLEQAVESLADGLLMVDTKYRLVLVNSRLKVLLGLPSAPTIFDIVNALSGQLDLRTKMEEAIAKEEPLSPVEITVEGKILQVLVSRVLDRKTRKPIGTVVLFNDITDAKSLETLRRDFTSMMVHELRSPLTSIKSTVELLQNDFGKIKTEDLKKYLATIDSTSQSMLEVVGDLLDVAKMEAGKFDVVCENAEVEPLILDRVESYKPVAQTKNIKISTDIEPDLPKGYFDKVRIKQVLNNLLSNAIKYTEAGEIKIKVIEEKIGEQGQDILVSISDTGAGIDADQVSSLFSKFGQLEAGRKKAGLSSGLGLFIAKGIIEAWGGKIGVKSDGLGMGSTFYFTIPLAREEHKSMPGGSMGAEHPTLVTGRVVN